MRTVLKARRGWSRAIAAPVLALSVAVVAACGGGEANVERGRDLFVAKCGTCHKLDEAATTADVGPDLDAAFVAARASGMDSDTIEGVVANQIDNPREFNNLDSDDPGYSAVYMPPDLVTGRDAEDVAAYVASVAGVPGIKPPEAPGGPGGQVFANNGCGACHTLAAAQSNGATGPNLDEAIPGQDAARVEQSIVDPNAQITNGFPSGVMPEYEGEIEGEDLELLVDFLLKSSGKGGGGN